MTERSARGAERRLHRRGASSARMSIGVDGHRQPVTALNVSVGGVAVHTSAVARVGSIVEVEARFPGDHSLTLDAEVVRASGGVLGLRFLTLDQRALEALLEASGISEDSGAEAPSGVHHVGEPGRKSRSGS
jgi:hypothetical protein